MNAVLEIIAKGLNDDELYEMFEIVIHEMNKRKDKEVLEQQKAVKDAEV